MTGGRVGEALLAEIRARLPLPGIIGRRVRLAKAGKGWSGLCPFHAEKNPSFSVYPDHFHCFGCGAHGDVVGFVMRAEGLDFRAAVERCAAEAGLAGELADAAGRAPWVAPPAPAAPRDAAPDTAERSAMAWPYWDRAAGIGEAAPVAQYLAGRGLGPLPEPCRAVLRQAALRHRATGEARHPVMLARVDGPDGGFRAVHRTYLAPRPEGGFGKLAGHGEAKLMLGPVGAGAVRLFPAAPLLGLAEGIETALAAHRLSGLPVWACLSTTGLAAVELPFDVEQVVIFADRDPPRRPGEGGYHGPAMPEGPGVFFARKLAERLRRQSVRAEIRTPLPPAKDYADVLAARAAEVAA